MLIQELKRRVVLAPQDAGARYDLAEALFGAGNAAAAITELEKALALDPDHDNARRLLWRCYVKEERMVPAERTLREALRRRPQDREVREELAEVMLSFDRPDDALMHLEVAIETTPHDAGLRKKAALLAMRKRLLARALRHLERAVAIDGGDDEVRTALLELRQRQGEVQGFAASPLHGGAELLLGRARAAMESEELRGSGHGPLRAAVVALRGGDAAGAKRALASATAAGRADPAFALLAGEVALVLGDRGQARRFFERAAGGRSRMALSRLAEIDAFEGRTQPARMHLQRILAGNPEDAETLETLGDIQAGAGATSDALQSWQAALQRRADPMLAAKVHAARSGVTSSANSTVGTLGALGYSAHGGTVSTIEAVAVPGKGELVLTGNVARVGREAVQVAHSCLKARAAELGIERAVAERDLHVHYVDTENEKDGPSAGLALALAGLSALSGRPLRAGLVASGEITLQGAVRAVGGLHEKVVAAWLFDMGLVILPRKNLFQARELPAEATGKLEVVYADTLREAMTYAFDGRQ